MAAVRNIIAAVTAVALAIAFVGLGFAACVLPPVTHSLSSAFARDDISPFDRNQLVRVADATRDFSFGAHDEQALYRAIYEVDSEFAETLKGTGGTVPADFPALGAVRTAATLDDYRRAFAGASELYCYSPDTISHLDDCHKIAAAAYPSLIAIAIVAVAGAVFTGVTGRSRKLGATLIAAGAIVIVAFLALGIWAAVDFNGFFTMFHQLLFSQGNWTFPYDSLLICSLPTEFWMGMGAVWLLTTVLACVISLLVGRKLAK